MPENMHMRRGHIMGR